MKTTIDIPEEVLIEAIRHTNSHTKREAVVHALEDFNKRQRLQKLVELMGQSDTFMSFDELMAAREASKKPVQ